MGGDRRLCPGLGVVSPPLLMSIMTHLYYEYYDTSPLQHLQTFGTQLRDEKVEITGNTNNMLSGA